MKKERKVIAVVLVALLVFLLGFGLGATKGIKIDINVEGAASAATVAATQAATVVATEATTAPTTAAPTAAATDAAATDAVVADTAAATDAAVADDAAATDAVVADTAAATDAAVADTAAASDAAATSSTVPSTTDEIVAKYNEVVNAAKKLQDGTIHKTSDVTLNCTDCSVGILKSVVNTALKALATSSDNTYTFAGGVGTKQADSSAADANTIFAPNGRDAALQSSYVASATANAEGDGYTMVITLNAETSTFDGTNTVNPVGHESCLDPLNLATLELPIDSAQITQADMSYPGATLTATVDGQGRLTKLIIDLPMSGSGTGAIKSVSLSVGIEGSMNDTYEITY